MYHTRMHPLQMASILADRTGRRRDTNRRRELVSMSLAEQLITRGWTQGESIDGEGHVCLNGALLAELGVADIEVGTLDYLRAVGDANDSFLAGTKVLNHLVARIWGHPDFVGYNDTDDRTFDEVLLIAKQFDEVVDWMKQQKA